MLLELSEAPIKGPSNNHLEIAMRHSRKLSAFAAAVWVLGCSDSPTAPHDHELIVDFAISTEHIHTLDAVTFTVTVTDEHGDFVTDFTSLGVEYELEGSATWRPSMTVRRCKTRSKNSMVFIHLRSAVKMALLCWLIRLAVNRR